MEPTIPSVLRVSLYSWTGSYESRWAVLGQEKTMNRVATRVGRETRREMTGESKSPDSPKIKVLN